MPGRLKMKHQCMCDAVGDVKYRERSNIYHFDRYNAASLFLHCRRFESFSGKCCVHGVTKRSMFNIIVFLVSLCCLNFLNIFLFLTCIQSNSQDLLSQMRSAIWAVL